MVTVADNIIKELCRHIPMILSQLPAETSRNSRIANAVRMTRNNLRKLNQSYNLKRQQTDAKRK